VAQGPEGARLTPREEEVLALLVRGLKDREIAETLGLSYETTRSYVKTVRGKLGVGSRVEAARRHWAL
jgi:DNA-binding NarL/FixJ family response regulator